MAEAALSATQWVVAKALAPVTDGLLEAWEASRNFGLNIEALRDELLRVKATLEIAGRKEIGGPAMEELLQRLRDSAHNAKDLLDELDYFRIHDEFHNTHEAANEHGEGGVQDLARDARHTVKALGKQLASLSTYCFGANAGHPRQGVARQHVSCCAWQCGRRRLPGDSSSVRNANQAGQEIIGCMPKLGKLFPGSSSPHPHVSGDEDRGNAQQTPKLDFNRVDFSQRMKDIVEKLQPVRKDVNEILQGCGSRIALDIAQRRPPTTPQSAEPKLYGRDHIMNNIIHDITEGQYCDKGLTVLPIIGPGGMGKTTLIQHIYNNQQVQNHFPVRIWICVSFNFNRDKVLEEIKRYTPRGEDEKESIRIEELIVQRLKSKRFLLVLDDIWHISNGDDWKRLLLTLGQSEKKGSMILVTTRQKEIAHMVKTTDCPKELNCLEPGEFRKLFIVYVFDAEQYPGDKLHLLDTGDEIMGKLKGSPLAANTVGRLLRTDPSLAHWRRVLNSKQWAKQTNGIMPALELSYDFLPFHLQRCFSCSALFPEDYRFRSRELISLWIGLDILTPCDQNPTFEGIGLSILNDLVIHGFFREYKTHGDPWYVMHDLLHELALKVASHDCLSFRLFDVGSVEIKPSTRHLSISIENLGEYNAVSGQKLKRELEKLKTRLKVEHLQTLMLFGRMDEGFAKIFGDFFGEANALRVLYLPHMKYPVESMLHNFSGLVHLRFLCLGTWEREVHLPLSISKFYHLRVLDLQSWYNSGDFPEDMSNLAKLCNYYTPRDDELHSDICNVGKLKLLEKLKVFRVNKKSEGFEPKQLEHLTKLWELGIYNLEKIHTEDEAAQAKLIEKKCLRRLTLDWDSEQSSVEPGMEGVVLQSLQPHGDLQVLCIRGYGGPSCPTWLGDVWDLRELRLNDMARLKEFIIGKSFCMLIKLELIGLESFEKWVYTAELETSPGWRHVAKGAHIFPALQVLIIKWCPKILEFPISNHTLYPDWFPKLQELVIQDCPEFSSAIPISWIESLRSVMIKFVKLLEKFEYSKSSNGAKLEITGKGDLHSLDQVLVFDKETSLNKLTLERCPSLELKHLLMLTSLKTLIVNHSDDLVGPLGGQGDVEWQLPVEHMRIWDLNGNSGEELTELLPHLPKLSRLEIWRCKNIKKLVVGVDVQQTTSEALEMGGGEITAAAEEDDDGVLLFPPHLCDSLRELEFYGCPELVLGKGFCMLIKLELIGLASFEKWVYPAELEASLDGEQLPTDAHMFPLLRVLIIRECPKFLEFPISNHILYPDWFPKLQELEIQDCPEFSSVISISWIESLRRVTVKRVKLLEEFEYSKSSDGVELKIKGKGDLHGLDQVLVFDKETSLEKLTLEWFDSLHRVTIECVKLLKRFAYSKSSDGAELEIIGWGDLQSLDQVLVFDKETGPEKLTLSSCPPLELKHLLVLTSLKTLIVEDSDGLVGPLGGQGDVEWQLPVEHIRMCVSNGNSGEELTDLLPHLPKLSKLEIMCCGKIKKLVVGVDEQQTTSEASEMGGGEITAAAEEEDDGVLLFPPHLCDSLRELEFDGCPELVLVDPPTHVPGGGWLQALRSLQRLKIMFSPKFLSAFSFSCHIFPSSLQFLKLCRVEGMGTLEPLSNLSSLVTLELRCCGEDLECQGLQSLLTTGGQLNELKVIPSPRFFAGWNHNHGRALEDVEGEEQQIQPVSSTLQELSTDDAAGLLSSPICSFLSSSLTKLQLCGYGSKRVERFSKEQEDALQLLSSLQELNFSWFDDLQQLPAGLRNLTSLKKLTIYDCPAASSFPNDGLPKSLQKLNVRNCKNQELKQQCRGLAGAIPKIIID